MMELADLQALSHKLDSLISYCRQLEHDNALLRQMQDEWSRERSQLLQKNDLARNKIEAMIGRLKALEQR